MNHSTCGQIEILLVEDSSSDVRLMEEAFQRCGMPYRLRAAKNISEALALVRCEGPYSSEACPDLIVLDLQLASERGTDFLKMIKEDEKLKVIPVIILSSSRLEADVHACYSLHANCYITKPILFNDLEQIAASLLNYWSETAVLAKPHF